jgi:predicted permease
LNDYRDAGKDLRVHRIGFMTFGYDLQLAFRRLRKSPGFTSAAILSLALGIGANAAVFSIVNGLFLHPAGIARPQEVVAPRVTYKKLNLIKIDMSATDFADVRNSTNVFSKSAIAETRGYNYTGGDSPERLVGSAVSWQWFDVFGARPIVGRTFRREEDQPGANDEAILSYETWQRLFGGDRGVIGRTIELNRKPYRIVGLMPASFHWPAQAELWTPIGLPAEAFSPQSRFNEHLTTVARLRPGVSYHAAAAFMKVLTERAKNSDPRVGSFARSAEWSMGIEPFTEMTSGNVETPMLILLGAVAFVLLIACSNIAGLMLVRATGRARELAIRMSLGASRMDLVKQAFAESLALSLAGTLLGLLAASSLLKVMVSLAPAQLASGVTIKMDGYVLLFEIAAGLLTAFLFGLAPAWHMSRLGQRYERLKEGGRSNTEGRQRQTLRTALVVAQVALALVLLFGAGLFIKSLGRLRAVDTGFRPYGVVSASVALPDAHYHEEDTQSAFYRAVLEKLSNSAGVQSAAVVSSLPFSGDDSSASFNIEGRIDSAGDPGPHGGIRSVSARYFEAMGIKLLAGRYFSEADGKDSLPVAIIDENLARQYWPNQDPIGKRLRNGQHEPWSTIVGLVAHVKHSQLAADSGKGVYYFPIFQPAGGGAMTAFIIARGSGDSAALGKAIRRAVQSVDPTQAVYDLKTMDERIALALGPQQFAVSLLTLFAGAALLLAALGLYGVINYSVAQRTRELGLRAALGARPPQILRMVIGQGMRLAGGGAILGFMAAAGLARLISSQLFQVSSFDPATFVLSGVVLGAAAFLAAYLPAWRATRVDPITALREA